MDYAIKAYPTHCAASPLLSSLNPRLYETQKSLRTRAVEILSRREISRAELKRKLAPYADGEEEIEKVLAEICRAPMAIGCTLCRSLCAQQKPPTRRAQAQTGALQPKAWRTSLSNRCCLRPMPSGKPPLPCCAKNSNNRPPIWPVSEERDAFSRLSRLRYGNYPCRHQKRLGRSAGRMMPSKPRSPTTKHGRLKPISTTRCRLSLPPPPKPCKPRRLILIIYQTNSRTPHAFHQAHTHFTCPQFSHSAL